MEKRNFSREFKLQVVQELQSGKSVTEVCNEHDLKSTLVCRWRREYQKNPEHAFSGEATRAERTQK
jgi:transposase